MAAIGHAADCAACTYDALPDEDKADLEPEAFTEHTRQEPPRWTPSPWRRPLLIAWGACGALLLLAVALHAPLLGNVAAIGIVVTIPVSLYVASQQRRATEAWDSRARAWRDAQTTAWLTARNSGHAWPCPTCGSPSCPNRHSVTTTQTVRIGNFYSSRSRTDPR